MLCSDVSYKRADRGYEVRRDALALAAEAFKSGAVNHDNPGSDLWSLAVFFESYLCSGAEGTMRQFGPRGPVKLKIAAKRQAIGR